MARSAQLKPQAQNSIMDISLLKKFTPFDGMQEEYLYEALDHIKIAEFHKGHMLFKRGRAIAARYFLLDGHIDLIDSRYQAQPMNGGTQNARTMLNPESPTRCSCVIKDPTAKVFSIDAETLDRLTAWSESAEAAFESEMDGKSDVFFNPSATGQFDVLEVDDETSSDWMSALLKSPLFTRVPLTHVQDLFSRFSDSTTNAGDVIIKEGQKGDYFYVIAKGRVRISNHLGSIDVELGPGQHFGEEALLGATLRNATVTMIQNGELKRLNSDDFQALLTEPVLEFTTEAGLSDLDKPYKLIDVKMPLEYRAFHRKGSINLPLARLRRTIPELANSSTYVIAGDAGSRAKIAAHLLCQAGFDAVILKSPDIDAPELVE